MSAGDAVVGIQPVEGLLPVAGGGLGIGGALLQSRVGVGQAELAARGQGAVGLAGSSVSRPQRSAACSSPW